MHKGRLEAFTDGVIAIILTVMVLELKVPPGDDLVSFCRADGRELLIYALSFTFLGIYWSNHHHMVQAAKHVNGAVLWANLHLLFWLSLIPFGTEWMGRSDQLARWPVVFYGADLLLAAVAYFVLARTLVLANHEETAFATALGRDLKGKISVVIYAVAIGLAFITPAAAATLYVAVALMWIVPDRRFERR